ncbi:MAG: twitching motility protein PilT [Spirochaetaceae bacterium]|nr:MAG: twitching motility protein PilT [Spirochaetaceae bacterium]
MPDRLADPFFDTVTLSNFAVSGAFELLLDRYGRSLRVTEQVRAELAAGRIRGYSELEVVERALAEGTILPTEPMTMLESELFVELLRTLGSGEASCLALARHRGGVVVTDDRTARSCCAERGVPVTGSIGILKALCIDRSITSEDADAILSRMVDAGFYSPVRRISDLL